MEFGAWIHQPLDQGGTVAESRYHCITQIVIPEKYYQRSGNCLFMVVCAASTIPLCNNRVNRERVSTDDQAGGISEQGMAKERLPELEF